MKRDATNLKTSNVSDRFLKQTLLHGIDGDLISGGLLSTGSVQTTLAESSTQNYTLGSKLRMKDGRVFRYALNGAGALVKGFMTQGPAVVTNYTEEVQTAHGIAIGLSAGNILITTGATPAANLFKDGWLVVNKGAGIGQVRRILTSGSHATIIAVTFQGALETAIAAASECSLIQSPFKAVIVMPTGTPTNIPTGVPAIAVTASYYCWLQTGGPCGVIVDTAETVVIGEPVGNPAVSAVAGACGVNVTVKTRWGPVMFVAAAAEPALINLQLDT